MADRGIIPKVMGTRNAFGTPTYGIILSASGVLVLAWLSFSEVIEMLNILYCFAQLIEFAAFIYLRAMYPQMHRPYRVPLEIPGLIMMLALPTIFILIIISISSFVSVTSAFFLALFGFVVYELLEQSKVKGWFVFENQYEHSCPSLATTEDQGEAAGGAIGQGNERDDELENGILSNGQHSAGPTAASSSLPSSKNQPQKVSEMTPLLGGAQ
jgi:hypothetical protein